MASGKTKRRKPATGTIRYKEGRDQPYEAAFPLDHGRYRYDYFSTRPEAEAHLDRLVAERDSTEQPRNITGGSQRVDQFLPAWLESKRQHIRYKTLRAYTYYCELASGQIGALRLDQMSRERADALLGYFHRRGFQNVAQLRACLLQAFKYAFEEDYIKKNPFAKAKAPPVKRRPGNPLSEAERTLMLMFAATEDRLLRDAEVIPLCPLWHIYSRLGLRKGEGIGLLWGRGGIDLDSRTLTVSRQITAAGKLQYTSEPKTPRSQRTLPLLPDLVELLKRHKDDQIKRAAGDPEWKNQALVFPGLHGAPVSYWYITSRWRALCKRAEIEDVTIHDLRHTALTLLELAGTPQNVVQAVAGHSTQVMTRHYVDHVDLENMRRAMGA